MKTVKILPVNNGAKVGTIRRKSNNSSQFNIAYTIYICNLFKLLTIYIV